MSEQLESRLRRHLSTVDAAPVADASVVAESARRAGVRLRTRRRIAVGAASAVVVLAAGAAIVVNRPEPADTVTSPVASSADSAASSDASTDSAVPVETNIVVVPNDVAPTEPAPTEPPSTPPETTAPASVTTPIPLDPRGPSFDPTVVWTGAEAIVLGGRDLSGGVVPGASAYVPASNTWHALTDPQLALSATTAPLTVWTGDELIVLSPIGASSFRPASDSWRSLAAPPATITTDSPAAWTGQDLLVWPSGLGPQAYRPADNFWRALAASPLEPRENAASVWTGSEWIIWGGTDGTSEFADGAAYSPATDTWRRIAPSPLGPRRVKAVWTGTEMLVFAGSRGGDPITGNGELALDDGAAYDPATDTWRSLTSGPAHPGFVPVWTGTHLLMFAKGGVHVYDLAADRWIDCCDREVLDAQGGTPAWTGDTVIVIGGGDSDRGGVIFHPDL